MKQSKQKTTFQLRYVLVIIRSAHFCWLFWQAELFVQRLHQLNTLISIQQQTNETLHMELCTITSYLYEELHKNIDTSKSWNGSILSLDLSSISIAFWEFLCKNIHVAVTYSSQQQKKYFIHTLLQVGIILSRPPNCSTVCTSFWRTNSGRNHNPIGLDWSAYKLQFLWVEAS